MNKKTIVTCPYLGLAADPKSNFGEPSDAQICYSPRTPGKVDLPYQQTVCLTKGYCDCKRFVQPKTETIPAPVLAVAPRTTPAWHKRLQNRMWLDRVHGHGAARIFETGLWSIAAVLVLVTAYLALPLINKTIAPLFVTRQNLALVVPTPTSTPSPTPSPTSTLLPTATPSAAQIEQPTSAPLIIPTPPANGFVLSLSPDPALTGWIVSSEPSARWGDRLLLVGSLKNENYVSVLHFDFPNLPPGSEISYAALELTGRDATQVGKDGAWQLELMDGDVAKNWSDQPFDVLANTAPLTTVGTALTPADFGDSRANDFIFGANELDALSRQLGNGGVTLRVRAANTTGDSLFAWSGATTSAGGLDAPTLYLVVVPKPFVVVTNTPVPTNVFTAAAQALAATAQAKLHGTPTPFPPGVATATPDVPIVYVPPPPTAANVATRQAESNYATAVAITTGTFTPTPKNILVQYPTQTPVLIDINQVVPPTSVAPSGALNYFATPIPAALAGKILVQSNRLGQNYANLPLVMDETGHVTALLSTKTYYDAAFARESFAPDRKRRAIVAPDFNAVLQIWILDLNFNTQKQITNVTRGIAYDAVWSPDGTRIAYVSTQTGHAELYVYNIETQATKQLTVTTEPNIFNQRPSWSPDSQKLAFKSNRDDVTHFQIYVIGADGSGMKNISLNQFDEVDPVWVKP